MTFSYQVVEQAAVDGGAAAHLRNQITSAHQGTATHTAQSQSSGQIGEAVPLMRHHLEATGWTAHPQAQHPGTVVHTHPAEDMHVVSNTNGHFTVMNRRYKPKRAKLEAAADDKVPAVPERVRKAAARGLALRKQHSRGGTAVGVARARDLMRGRVSWGSVKRMKAYFDRHEVDKQGKGWGRDSAGYIAWLLWGGDAGYSWSRKLMRSREAA